MTVGVIGAGISGLGVVHELAETGIDVQSFERDATPGGLMRSRTVEGRVLDLGPQRLRLTPPLRELVADLGLEESLRIGTDEPLYVYHDGQRRLAPRTVRELVRTDLLSLTGKFRLLLEPFTGRGTADETVDGFLRRKFGGQAAERLLGPVYSGLYGTDPTDMLFEYTLERALERAGIEGSLVLWALRQIVTDRPETPICSFDDGLREFPAALYEAHADSIALETPVTEIEPISSGYRLHTANESVHVEDVVLTTPAPAAANLLAPVDETVADRLGQLRYNPIAVVHLESAFDEPGIGTIVPDSEPLRISGTTWNARILDRDSLFTCYLDPGAHPGMEEASDDTLATVAAEAFETLTGTTARPIHVHRWRPGMPAYDRSWRALDDLSLPPGIHLCTNFVARPGILGRLRHAAQIARDIESDR